MPHCRIAGQFSRASAWSSSRTGRAASCSCAATSINCARPAPYAEIGWRLRSVARSTAWPRKPAIIAIQARPHSAASVCKICGVRAPPPKCSAASTDMSHPPHHAVQGVEDPFDDASPVEPHVRIEQHARLQREPLPKGVDVLRIETHRHAIHGLAQGNRQIHFTGSDERARDLLDAAPRTAVALIRKGLITQRDSLTRLDETDCAARHEELCLEHRLLRQDAHERCGGHRRLTARCEDGRHRAPGGCGDHDAATRLVFGELLFECLDVARDHGTAVRRLGRMARELAAKVIERAHEHDAIALQGFEPGLLIQRLLALLAHLQLGDVLLRGELAGHAPEAANRRAAIARDIEALEQQLTEYESRRRVVITAPTAGTVTAILAERGQTAVPTAPLLSILPEQAVLEAQLLVPSRAIGFIEPGQRVALRYEAFPYQRYGSAQGRIKEIARTLITPGEVNLPVALREPVYRVTVSLDAQYIDADRQRLARQSGMLLDADVWRDRRRIIEWVFDPLYSVMGRV